MRHKEVHNEYLRQFCAARGHAYPREMAQIVPTIDAGYKSFFKYNKSPPLYEREVWDCSYEWTMRHFWPAMCASRVLTQAEVVSSLDLSTSCGYPWSLKYFTKRDFLESIDRFAISDYWDSMLSCEKVPIWTCAQKRELREMQKVIDEKHRTFTASPIELTVASNRLCLDMNEKLYGSGLTTWSFVGNSKYFRGWHMLYEKLSRRGLVVNNAFELDETEYDSSIFANALYDMVPFRFAMLRTEDRTSENLSRLERLYDHIVNSYVIMEDGHVVRKYTGNPSGSGNTITDNTIILFRLFVYAWLMYCKKKELEPDYAYFMTTVCAALYGDDNTYTVTDEHLDFDPPFIKEIWSSIGVITKTPCDAPRPLHDVCFLSHSFVWDAQNDMWLPMMQTDKLMNSLASGSEYDDIRWHLLRAFALRVEGFSNKIFYAFVEQFIEYLYTRHRNLLRGSFYMTSAKQLITMEEIEAMRLPESQLVKLYTGHEAGNFNVNALLNSSIDIIQSKLNLLNLKFQSKMTKGHKKHKKLQSKHQEKRKPAKQHKPKRKTGIIHETARLVGAVTGARGISSAVGNYISRVTGHGDYKVSSNSLTTSPSLTPSFSAGNETFTVKHTEYIKDIFGSTDFLHHDFNINPTNRVLFPWLSSIAVNYEKYNFKGLLFHYKSTSANALNSTNTALGTVIMTTEYDVSKPPFHNKMEAENYEFSNSGPPSMSMLHPVECKASSEAYKWRYTESPQVVPGAVTQVEENLLNHGRFQLSTVGMQAAANIGELWVTYDVVFTTPRVPPGGSSQTQQVYAGRPNSIGPYNSSTTAIRPLWNYNALQTDPRRPAQGLADVPEYYVSASPQNSPKPVAIPGGGSTSVLDFGECPVGSCWQVTVQLFTQYANNTKHPVILFPTISDMVGVEYIQYFHSGLNYLDQVQAYSDTFGLFTFAVRVKTPTSVSAGGHLNNDYNYMILTGPYFNNYSTDTNNITATVFIQQIPYEDGWYDATLSTPSQRRLTNLIQAVKSQQSDVDDRKENDASDVESVTEELGRSLHIDANTLSSLLKKRT